MSIPKSPLDWLWMAVAVAVLVCSSRLYQPITARGVHCPTAEVQTIALVDPSTGAEVRRKPVEGEAEFKQCQCAEKQAAPSKSEGQRPDGPAWVLPPAILGSISAACDGAWLQLTSSITGGLFSLSDGPPVPPLLPPPIAAH